MIRTKEAKKGKTIKLVVTKRTDMRLLHRMAVHYSQPKGFVGRNICYAIYCGGLYFGHIVAGSACLHLPNRDEFFGIQRSQLNNIVNNIFYNIQPTNDKYPFRNFTTAVLKQFMSRTIRDWCDKYGDNVIGFETLIEKPRTGELYYKAGFEKVGVTQGHTCKRVAGKGYDNWSGKRVWDTCGYLRPKDVLCYRV